MNPLCKVLQLEDVKNSVQKILDKIDNGMNYSKGSVLERGRIKRLIKSEFGEELTNG